MKENKKLAVGIKKDFTKKKSGRKRVSHREVCYRILKERGKPMHYKKITEEVLKECKSVGKTPQNTMYARMLTDKKRFKLLGKGKFALLEWENKAKVIKNAK